MADEENEQNPFTRPGFIGAAVVVAIVVVLGIILAVRAATDDSPDARAATPPTGATPTGQPTAAADGSSVCGLEGAELGAARLTTAPAVDEWKYQGTTAYPVSSKYGPGKTAPEGFRYCFQHSPAGALFAAANAVVQGSDAKTAASWLDYFVATGPHRSELLSNPGTPTEGTGTRLAIVGFRVLQYDGTQAHVDLAVSGTAKGRPVTLSGVYDLVWQGGDWKISSETAQPLDMAAIPDAAGYIAWGESSG